MDPHIDNLFAKAFNSLGHDIVENLKELDPDEEYGVNGCVVGVEIERKSDKQSIVISLQDVLWHLTKTSSRQDRFEKLTIPVHHMAEVVLWMFT